MLRHRSYPKYEAQFTIVCRNGDVNGYLCSQPIVAIDDEDALEEYQALQERRRKEQSDAGSHIMVTYQFHGLFRIHSKIEIPVFPLSQARLKA
jgi:hypothetical protein